MSITQDEENRPLSFTEVLPLALSTPALYLALADLREVMREPINTAFFCKRAIEDIRRYFVDKTHRDDKGWSKLQSYLHVYPSYTADLTASSEAERHGEHSSVNAAVRVEYMLQAWKVVDRFIIYLKSGGATLPLSKRPLQADRW